MIITPDLLVEAVGCSRAAGALWSTWLDAACRRFGISETVPRLAMFFAHTGHESASLSRQTESLNYTPARLLEVFGRHRISEQQAHSMGRTNDHEANQVAIACQVYGGEWGRVNLGNRPGTLDGWDFRGRGPIGLTGRDNYAALTRRLRAAGIQCPDFEVEPEALEQPEWGALSAADFWNSRNLNPIADAGDFNETTRRINGGMNGQPDRLVRLQRALRAVAAWAGHGAAIAPAPAPAHSPTPAEAPAAPPIPAGDADSAPENHMALPLVGILGKIGTTLVGGLAAGLIDAFAPVAKQKVVAELERHGADSAAAAQIIGSVVDAAKTLTGDPNPITATATAVADPAVLEKVADDTLATIERLAPLLEKVVAWERQDRQDDEASRDAASNRSRLEDYDMTGPLLQGALRFAGGLTVFVCMIALIQLLKTDTIATEVWSLIAGLVGTVFGIVGTIYAYRFGTSRSSGAKDIVIGELSRRPRG